MPQSKGKNRNRPKTRGAERTAAVVGPITREPAPIRNTRVGLPVFELKGGPYDGLDSDDEAIDSTLFFPTEVHVVGKEGPGVYTINGAEAKFDRVG